MRYLALVGAILILGMALLFFEIIPSNPRISVYFFVFVNFVLICSSLCISTMNAFSLGRLNSGDQTEMLEKLREIHRIITGIGSVK